MEYAEINGLFSSSVYNSLHNFLMFLRFEMILLLEQSFKLWFGNIHHKILNEPVDSSPVEKFHDTTMLNPVFIVLLLLASSVRCDDVINSFNHNSYNSIVRFCLLGHDFGEVGTIRSQAS